MMQCMDCGATRPPENFYPIAWMSRPENARCPGNQLCNPCAQRRRDVYGGTLMTRIPLPASAEQQTVALGRFIKRVAEQSNDEDLARAAEEMIVLYGDPDAPKPTGVIRL